MIKFRVFDLIEKCMRYDIGAIEFNGLNKTISGIGFNYDLEYSKELIEYYDANCFEIMQYVGFNDINNREVYHHDILNYYGENREVIYKNLAYGWYESEDFISFSSMSIDELSKAKVVGNSYENKDLLGDDL